MKIFNSMKKRLFTILAVAILSVTASYAQALTGTYFLDNSLFRTRLNPAFSPRANYFGIPVLANTGVGVYGNVGAGSFLFPKDGQLYTFLNKNVSVEEFERKLTRYPGADINFNTDILNFGFYTSSSSFWSFDLGIQMDASIGIPKDFLMILKQGMGSADNIYSLKGFNMFADASLYAAIGHSRDLSSIVKGLKVGAKFKFLASVASIGMDLGESTLELSQDKWTVNSKAQGTIATPLFRIVPSEEAGKTPSIQTNLSKIAPAGYGFAFDLGAEYRLSIGSPVDGMTFSLSVLDLGGRFYKSQNVQHLVSEGSASFSGMNDISLDNNADFSAVAEEIKNDFLALANFKEGEAADFKLSTFPKIYAGVEMPFLHDKMSVGLLYSAKFMRRSTINELTLSYNLNPCKWFNLGVNWSFLNAWKTLGWVIEFSPKAGVDFFIGSDYTFFNVMPKYYIPVDKAWANMRFGLNFMLGSKHK